MNNIGSQGGIALFNDKFGDLIITNMQINLF